MEFEIHETKVPNINQNTSKPLKIIVKSNSVPDSNKVKDIKNQSEGAVFVHSESELPKNILHEILCDNDHEIKEIAQRNPIMTMLTRLRSIIFLDKDR